MSANKAVLAQDRIELEAYANDHTLGELVELWNGLPGVKQVRKFTDRETAVRRIWAALHPDAGDTGAANPKDTPKAKVIRNSATSGRKTAKKAKVSLQHKHEKRRDRAIALMSRAGGVTLAELAKKMDWELHTARGFVSILGSKHRIKIKSFKDEAGERTYQIK